MREKDIHQSGLPDKYMRSPSLEAMYRIGKYGVAEAIRFTNSHPQNHLYLYDSYTYERIAEVTGQNKRIVIGDVVIEASSYGNKKGGEVCTPDKIYYYRISDDYPIYIEGVTVGVRGT